MHKLRFIDSVNPRAALFWRRSIWAELDEQSWFVCPSYLFIIVFESLFA